MKIALLAQTYAPQDEGGAEISARLTARELARRHDVTIIALGLAGDPVAPPGASVTADGLRLIRLPYGNSYLPGARRPAVSRLAKAVWHLRAAGWGGGLDPAALRRVLADGRFDLLYANNSARMQPALFRVAQDVRLPLVLHLRDYALLCARSSLYSGGRPCAAPCLECRLLTHRANREAASATTAVIAVSHAVKDRFLAAGLFTQTPWHVLHNTNTPRSAFNPTLIGRRVPASGPFTFGYLGGLSEEKGAGFLVRAFGHLPPGTARLILAGRGDADYEAHLRHLARGHAVEFPGHVDPAAVMGIADAILVPSLWHEPQSRVVIESAVYGVPVIGSARGGTPEVIDRHRIGWHFDPDDPNALPSLLAAAARTGKEEWWRTRDQRFPGLSGFAGTAEDSGYHDALDAILTTAGTARKWT